MACNGQDGMSQRSAGLEKIKPRAPRWGATLARASAAGTRPRLLATATIAKNEGRCRPPAVGCGQSGDGSELRESPRRQATAGVLLTHSLQAAPGSQFQPGPRETHSHFVVCDGMPGTICTFRGRQPSPSCARRSEAQTEAHARLSDPFYQMGWHRLVGRRSWRPASACGRNVIIW